MLLHTLVNRTSMLKSNPASYKNCLQQLTIAFCNCHHTSMHQTENNPLLCKYLSCGCWNLRWLQSIRR